MEKKLNPSEPLRFARPLGKGTIKKITYSKCKLFFSKEENN